MCSSLFSPFRLARFVAAFGLIFAFSTFFSFSFASHGSEGSTGAAATGAAVTGSQVLALKGHASQSLLSDSLWGSLLLSMAYQRDPVIQHYARRLNRVNSFTMLSIAGISGLGLAQSITSLNNTQGSQTLHVVDHGHGPHVHPPADSKTPATLGIVGSGATLATLGVKAVLDNRYGRRLADRQRILKERIEQILSRFENDENLEQAEAELSGLVGHRAAREFVQLWGATH